MGLATKIKIRKGNFNILICIYFSHGSFSLIKSTEGDYPPLDRINALLQGDHRSIPSPPDVLVKTLENSWVNISYGKNNDSGTLILKIFTPQQGGVLS